MEPIAITGIGCRFPGAASPAAFWRLLCAGEDAIREVPPERWDLAPVYDPDPLVPGKITTRWGGFLPDIDRFDPLFFKIAQREASLIDPQQRLLLEVAWEALEDGGYVAGRLAGSQTGVFVGIGALDHATRQMRAPDQIDAYTNTGAALSIAANRISYVFDLRGPSLIVDTACSSSLVAIHLACQSLRAGECALALAGGVNLILGPESTIGFSKLGAMAPDGRCKAFDARANGYVRSEGAGVVVLKPLRAALADGDPIYAVIRGSAVNQDGRTNGLTAPNRWSQEQVLRDACAQAGVAPETVDYVEAHGTGTLLGDPIEAQALGAVLAPGRPDHRPCLLGSVKTNIGHLEFAAGVAGVIKVALMCKHRMVPPNLHFQTANPHIPFADLKLRVPTGLEPWTGTLAGVSSFGFGGTNAHAVLETPPPPAPRPAPAAPVALLPLSAHTPEALAEQARRYAAWLATPQAEPPALYDLCYSASVRRSHHPHRLALVACSLDELATQLAALAEQLPSPPRQSARAPKLVFVFPGQGSQWIGMGRELLDGEPVFRAAIEAWDAAFRPFVDWSLLDQLRQPRELSRLHEMGVIQPALCAVGVALAALWQSWGIRPDAVVGHSMGEVAAAYVAGVLSLEDAARVICCRSQLLRRIVGQGGMLVVEQTHAEAEALCEAHAGLISVAAVNDARSTVLAGDPAALEAVAQQLRERAVFARRVQVDVASHSPQVEPLLDELRELLAGLRPQAARLPIYSTVTAAAAGGAVFDADYWVRNLRQPVQFGPAVTALLGRGHDLFLEVSPHPVLTPSLELLIRQSGRAGAALASLRREMPERRQLLETLGQLYAQRCEPDWSGVYPQQGLLLALPSYPWQRERCWAEPPPVAAGHLPQPGIHPLLGQHLAPAGAADHEYWELDFGPPTLPYLHDHRVLGRPVLPAAAALEQALAAGRAWLATDVLELEQVAFQQLLAFAPEELRRVQLALTAQTPDTKQFELFSRALPADGQQTWTAHVAGTLRRGRPGGGGTRDLDALRARCSHRQDASELYRSLAARGLEYGPAFQGLASVLSADGLALARLEPTPAVRAGQGYLLHPALLDACFQTLGAVLAGQGSAQQTVLPVDVRRLRLYHTPPPGEPLWVVATRADAPLTGDLALCDQAGRVLLEVEGLRVQALEPERAPLPDVQADWFYQVVWEPAQRPATPERAGGRWLICAADEGQGRDLAGRLGQHGASAVIVTPGDGYRRLAADHYQIDPPSPEQHRLLLAALDNGVDAPLTGVVLLWATAAPSAEALDPASLNTAQTLCAGALALVQALAHAAWRDAPRLWLVTRGTQAATPDDRCAGVAQAPLWGLGSVIVHEFPALRCTRLDLNPHGDAEQLGELCAELLADSPEDQIALRAAGRFVARLTRFWPSDLPVPAVQPPAGDEPFRLAITRPGNLDDMVLRVCPRRAPGPGEVEIAVAAAGLNFADVLTALGIAPGQDQTYTQMGGEASGVITAVGPGVQGLAVGDAVLACAPGCFRTHLLTTAGRVARIPPGVSPEEAAGLPMIFMTVFYGLHRLARLERGERVLIHSAASGTGLAALQFAQRAGAEIFATAGTAEKRAALQALGVRHVWSSRTLDFAEQILEQTGGAGVDVVLNSLSGPAIAKNFAVLGPYGRYIELSKRDIYQNTRLGLAPFRRSLAYFAVDLAGMAFDRPQLFDTLFQEVVQLFAAGELRPLPTEVVPVQRVADAFHTMAQARHRGKLVVSMAGRAAAPLAPAQPGGPLVRSQATYLLTGGLGGIGLRLARWLVAQGARHLALVGRSQPSPEALAKLAALAEAGASVQVYQADASSPAALADVLGRIADNQPPLRGVFHAAGVLDDAMLLQQDAARFERVMAPKIAGAWNLHRQTRDLPLDLFVLFSSAAAVLGSPGQGNYAAANAFLDALAHMRRAAGLPALSINWGPWAEVGMAAAQGQRGERLAALGIGSIGPDQSLAALGRLLQEDSAQVSVMALNLRQWRESFLQAARLPLLARLEEERSQPSTPARRSSVRARLEAAAPGERLDLLEEHLKEQLGRVLHIPLAALDRHSALGSLGLDSLTALELRNRLEDGLGMEFPVTLLWNYQTLADLAAHLAERLGLGGGAPAAGAAPQPAAAPELLLSDEQQNELIALLGEIDRLPLE
ncbi:MAG TPA: type I polyketide synthase [Roseiflexaceae bacterium]|nr:type I polyketide synthase [Roseiflexaceae bacterium]